MLAFSSSTSAFRAGLGLREIVLMDAVMVIEADRHVALRSLLADDILIELRDNLARRLVEGNQGRPRFRPLAFVLLQLRPFLGFLHLLLQVHARREAGPVRWQM